MDITYMYLRKSRADEELEKALGEGETLSKHRKALLKFAKEKGLNVTKIYEEIVSGESLIHRPQMYELLKEIEQRNCNSVLVMDKERLGRGDMQEQGLILNTFKEAHCKIITLQKTYDLNNEFDEEYSEFEAFMSRREFKMINRRMQGGRIRSVEEGNYIGTYPPYGYNIKKLKDGRTLEFNPKQAPVVELIFDMYVHKNMGCGSISEKLNSMGYKSYTGKEWSLNAVNSILKNPVYIGKVTWGKNRYKKPSEQGKRRIVKKTPESEVTLVNGKHDPIISEELFNRTKAILKNNGCAPTSKELKNPLAGLIYCGLCGSKMQLRPYYQRGIESHIICPKKCGNKSSKLSLIEQKVLGDIDLWYKNDILPIKRLKQTNNKSVLQDNLKRLESSKSDLEQQRVKIYDLLEQGVYTADIFIDRSQNLAERIGEIEKEISNCEVAIKEEENKNIEIPNVKKILDAYRKTKDINKKNMALKSLLIRIEYSKSKSQKNDDFTVALYTTFTSNL